MPSPQFALEGKTRWRIEIESDVIEFSQIGCEFALGTAFGQPLSASEARKQVGVAAEPVGEGKPNPAGSKAIGEHA
jgi:hypothetical protein